jgi:hypothetical protein
MGDIEVFVSLEEHDELESLRISLEVTDFDLEDEAVEYEIFYVNALRKDGSELELESEEELEALLSKSDFRKVYFCILEEVMY